MAKQDSLTQDERNFCQAIINAAPEMITATEAALRIGKSKASAAVSGSRWAKSPRVRAFLAEHFPAHPLGGGQVGKAEIVNTQSALFGDAVNFETVKAYLSRDDLPSDELGELVKLICAKFGTTTDPVAYWDSVLANPFSNEKSKLQAAKDKAAYTIAKPAAQGSKETQLAQAKNRFQAAAQGSLDFGETPQNTEFKQQPPKWVN